MPVPDDTSIEAHYEFGRNWRSYSRLLTQEKIDNAVRDLARLLPEGLDGKTFIDVGSGSGLSSLAALRLGCRSLQAIDYDPDSVETSRRLLESAAAGGPWSCAQRSALDLSPAADGLFDVVYSWGVLHHTGDMWRAIDRSCALVEPEGRFVVALYARTPLCGFWRREKRLYTHGPKWLRRPMEWLYKALYVAGLALSGRNPFRYIGDYKRNRGMDWQHDVNDWLGGYPYESATPDEVERFMSSRGFALVRAFVKPAPIWGALGSPCNEFVFRRVA